MDDTDSPFGVAWEPGDPLFWQGLDVYIRPMFSLLPDADSAERWLASAVQFTPGGRGCVPCKVGWSADTLGERCWSCGGPGVRQYPAPPR